MIKLIVLKDLNIGDVFYMIPSDKRAGNKSEKVEVVSVGRNFFYVQKPNSNKKIKCLARESISTLSINDPYVASTQEYYPDANLYRSDEAFRLYLNRA